MPSVYDLLDNSASMDGYNTSAGDGSGPAGNLHWTAGSQEAQMDPRGVPTLPDIQPFDLQQAMQQRQTLLQRPQEPTMPQQDRHEDAAAMQAYSDQLRGMPNLGQPSDYVQGDPQPRQSMGQQALAPLRDALSSLFHPGAASDPRLAPDPSMGATPGTLQGQSAQGAPDMQSYMRDRYRKYADLTDANMQQMQDQQRGFRRQDGIDQFLGRVVAPFAGGMMARGGNRYAMDAMNQYSKGAESRANDHRDEQYRLMNAANTYGKQAYDQMVASDPQTIKNQLALMKAQTDALRGASYGRQVDNQGEIGRTNAATNQQNAGTKSRQIDINEQHAQDLRDQFQQKMTDEVRRTDELLRNGSINRQLAEARIKDLEGKAGQFEQMMAFRKSQLASQNWNADANRSSALDRLLQGETGRNNRLDTEEQGRNTRAASQMVFNKDTGKMEPKYSAGFTNRYGIQDDTVADTSAPDNNPFSGIMNSIFGTPVTAAPQQQAAPQSSSYSPDDIAAMKAELARRRGR